jgi:hypothetical protein
MLVTYERWQDALRFLTEGMIGLHLTGRDQRLLALHLGRRPSLTINEATVVLTRVGWVVRDPLLT